MATKEAVMPTEHVLSIDELLAENQIEYAKVPGFKPGTVSYIGSVTAGDVIEWSEAGEGEAKRTAGLRLIVKSLVDGIPEGVPGGPTLLPDGSKATGKRIANDSHIPRLRNLSHKIAERFVRAILKLNGMKVPDGAKETEGEIEAKND